MKKEWQKGASTMEGVFVLVVLIVIMITSTQGERDGGSWGWTTGTTITSSASKSETASGSRIEASSSFSDAISLGRGNAARAYQSYEEYVTIDNRSRNSIDITGWQLRNGKDERPYYLNSSLQRYSADVTFIPQGTLSLSPSGNHIYRNIVLGPRERAIVTTGSVGVKDPFPITSFKENICTGYIEAHSSYAFNPPLSRSCPRPSLEPGIEAMDGACKDFIRSLSSCETPNFEKRDRDGEPCNNCVNNKPVGSACYAFIKEHYSYQGCLAYHSGDPEFSLRTWRVFLGRGWEMWAEEYETIELFDRLGQLADFVNY